MVENRSGDDAGTAEPGRLRSAPRRRPPDPSTVVALVGAAGAALVALIATAQGPGLSADSTYYLSAGINLARGQGLVDWNQATLTVFPPGLPLLVAAGQHLGLGAETTIRIVNAACFAATVGLGFSLLRAHVPSKALLRGATLWLAFSVPLLTVEKMAWTEPAFIVVGLALVLVLDRYADTNRPAATVLGAAALTWVAFGFRYTAVALIPAGGLALFLARRRRGGWRAAVAAGSYLALSSAGPVLWMLRNHRADGTYLGPRASSTDDLGTTAYRLVVTIGSWVAPGPVPAGALALIGMVVVAGAGGVIWYWRQHPPVPAGDGAPRPLTALGCFVGVYGAYLVVAQMTTAIEALGPRLLAPLYVPAVVLGVTAADRLVTNPAGPRSRAGPILVAGLIAVAGFQAAMFISDLRSSATEGSEFSSRAWRQTPLLGAIDRLPTDARLYTNAPEGVWAVRPRENLSASPTKHPFRSDEIQPIPDRFIHDVACTESYLAWFNEGGRNYAYTPSELEAVVALRPITTGSDGVLYRLGSRPGGAAPECAPR